MYDLDYTLKIMDKYCKEAEKCYEKEFFVGSFILYSAALEAALLALCFIHPRKVRKTKEYKNTKRESSRERGFFLEFDLKQLISIAEKLGWLPMGEIVKGVDNFKDWGKWVEESRNLIHVSRWLKAKAFFGSIENLTQPSSKKDYKKYIDISKEAISEVKNLISKEKS